MINPYKSSQYVMAVLLIMSSIAIAIYQVILIQDVASGVRWYIAQAFLLAGSIFGLDYYVKLLSNGKKNTQRDTQQQPSQHSDI